MSLDDVMTGFVVYPLVTTALYYLGSWALITRWLWSRYPPILGSLMSCAACSGFWYGLAAGALGARAGVTFPGGAASPLIVGLCAMVWTPLIAHAMLTRLEALHAPDEENAEDSET